MKHFVVVILSIFFVLVVLPTKIHAQALGISVSNFSIDHGLSQSVVTCVLQDSKGFIWVATQDGLNRYDGHEFKIFRYAPRDTTSISSNTIQTLLEDSKGNLWIGTQNGLNRFDAETGSFIRYQNDPNDPNSLFDNDVYSIYEDSKGYIWVKTSDWVERMDPETGKFTHYTYTNDPFNSIPLNNYFSIYEDYKGVVWIGSKDGLFFFDEDSEQLISRRHDPENPRSISNNDIRDIFEDDQNNLYIATGNGLNKVSDDRTKFTRYYVDSTTVTQNSFNIINTVFQDSSNVFWVGTQAGLIYFDRESGEFSTSHQDYEDITGLLTNQISDIIQDRSGLLWVGTWDNGLFKINAKPKKFTLYRSHPQSKWEMTSNTIASIYQETPELIWVGTWGYGLNIINRHTGKSTVYSTSSATHPLPDNYVHTIFKDNNGNILVGTRAGVTVFDTTNRRFVPFHQKFDVKPGDARVLNDIRINAIMQDHNNNLWFGTEKGVFKFDGTQFTSIQHNFTNTASSLSSDIVYDIVEDSEGYIWIGTRSGLDRLDEHSGLIHHYGRYDQHREGLSHNNVISLHEDRNGFIWIGTQSGLNKYDRSTGKFEFFTQKEGFVNDYIYAIVEDDNGILWLSTNRGVAKFNPSTEEITTYDIADGLQGNEFNLNAVYQSPKGEIFFGGMNGFNSFFPDSIHDNPTIPPISITHIEKFSENKSKTQIDLGSKSDTIYLTGSDYMFIVYFAALEFTRPEKNNYRYILEGYNDKWVPLGTQNYASFPKLSPGSYTFRVQGSNNDLRWNTDSAQLVIIVKPGIFNHPLSFIIYGIAIISLIFVIIRYRTKNLRQANQILKEKEKAAKAIKEQKEELSIKNKNITDSINYAKRIIEAMMPSINEFRRILPNSFLLYWPKDIVSGDFYWIIERNNKIFVAAVDCTGHGVPGALMSIIGFDLLKNITIKQGIEEPAQILNQLNHGIAETFGKDSNENQKMVADGMDLAFCVIDRQNEQLEYAGAFNPLYLLRDNNLTEIKADRFSVGMASEGAQEQKFTNHVLPIKKNDTIYMFSDGYADQFGGPKGKKFKYRRFRHLLLTIHKEPMEKQHEILSSTMNKWRGGHEQVDDILVMGIKL